MDNSYYAPYYNLKLSPTVSALVGKDPVIEIEMMLDTGATVCCIPYSVILEFEEALGHKLPFEMKEVSGFEGFISPQRFYRFNIIDGDLKHEGTLIFVAIAGEKGLIGRELLNQNILYLDGPTLGWQFVSRRILLTAIRMLLRIFGSNLQPFKLLRK